MPDGELKETIALAESPKQAILFHLENAFKIRKHEISSSISKALSPKEVSFTETIESIKQIMENKS